MAGQVTSKKRKLEPCTTEDLDKIRRANKDTLRVFAKKKFGVDLDLGTNLNILREALTRKVQIALNIIIENPKCSPEVKKKIESRIPRWLKHPINGRVNQASPQLLKRHDMIPCTEDGTPIHMPAMEEDHIQEDRGSADDELNRIMNDLAEETGNND
jgi:hypothetical protein